MPNHFTAAELAAKRIRIEQAARTRADADDILGRAFEEAREIVAGPYLRIVVEKSARWFRWQWFVLDETDLRRPVAVAQGSAVGERRANRRAWDAYRREREHIRAARRAQLRRAER